MENKTPRIHQLKGKSRLNLHPTTLTHKNSKQLLQVSQNLPQISYQASKPILIRYIDPRLVPIFKELNSLTTKCQEMAAEVKKSPQVAQQQKIQQLLQSTKKINDQFHEIIDNSEEIRTQPFKIECQAVPFDGPQDEIQKKQTRKEEISKQNQEQQFDPIDIVNRTSQKLQELELQNETLKSELLKQKKLTSDVELQNKELKQRLFKIERQKKEMLVNIKHELERLQSDNGIVKLTELNENYSQ